VVFENKDKVRIGGVFRVTAIIMFYFKSNNDMNSNLVVQQFFLIFLILFCMMQCTYKKNVNVELYQVYFDDRKLSGFGRRCYLEYYFLIINNTEDSINVEEIGNKLELIPDSIGIYRIYNDFVYSEFQPWVKFLRKQDSVFLMKRIEFKLYPNTEKIRDNLTSYTTKSHMENDLEVAYVVNPKVKYFFGYDRPYYMAKLDKLIALSKDDDRTYYEGLRDEYLMFYCQ
jgi:hypothetical protein